MANIGTTESGNVLADTWFEASKYPRRITRIAFVGSTAIGDIHGSLFYGNYKVADLVCTTKGAVVPDDDDFVTVSSSKYCPAGTNIRFELDTTPTGNDVRS